MARIIDVFAVFLIVWSLYGDSYSAAAAISIYVALCRLV